MAEESIDIDGKIYTQTNICKEPDEYIRLAAASQGFALQQLINDKSAIVRSSIARIKYGHEQLATDENWKVRATVAKYCKPKILDIMIHDENHFVRYVVAQRGFHFEYFLKDPDDEISQLARYELNKLT